MTPGFGFVIVAIIWSAFAFMFLPRQHWRLGEDNKLTLADVPMLLSFVLSSCLLSWLYSHVK